MNFLNLNLNDKIHHAIDQCGYQTPTEIQAKTIPHILSGQDLIGVVETGSGKTAAFVWPALNLLAQNHAMQRSPRILILTPTRELATQVTAAVRKYGKAIQFRVAKIIGGDLYVKQEKMLRENLDVIVATPGRLMDHMRKKRVDLSSVEMFILDEADRMLDMGFAKDILYIAESLPIKKQTLMFTATLHQRIIKNFHQLLRNPVTVDLSKDHLVPDRINQTLFLAHDKQQKIIFLEDLLQKKAIDRAIIFSATKMGADKLASHLQAKGHAVLPFHGDLNQRKRSRSVDDLRSGKVKYLVATDIAARGLDIKEISHVINFDFPKDIDAYIHRVGRTGRAGKTGEAITLATSQEKNDIKRLEKTIGRRLTTIGFDGAILPFDKTDKTETVFKRNSSKASPKSTELPRNPSFKKRRPKDFRKK